MRKTQPKDKDKKKFGHYLSKAIQNIQDDIEDPDKKKNFAVIYTEIVAEITTAIGSGSGYPSIDTLIKWKQGKHLPEDTNVLYELAKSLVIHNGITEPNVLLDFLVFGGYPAPEEACNRLFFKSQIAFPPTDTSHNQVEILPTYKDLQEILPTLPQHQLGFAPSDQINNLSINGENQEIEFSLPIPQQVPNNSPVQADNQLPAKVFQETPHTSFPPQQPTPDEPFDSLNNPLPPPIPKTSFLKNTGIIFISISYFAIIYMALFLSIILWKIYVEFVPIVKGYEWVSAFLGIFLMALPLAIALVFILDLIIRIRK